MADYMLDLRMGVDAKLNASTVEVNESTAGTISYAVDNRNLRIDAKKADGTFEKQLINADLAYGVRDGKEDIIAKPGYGNYSFLNGKFREEQITLIKLSRAEGFVDATYNYEKISGNIDISYTYILKYPAYEQDGKITYHKVDIINSNTLFINDFSVQYYTPDSELAYELIRNQDGAIGDYSYAEGYSTAAVGDYSHSEGYYTKASGLWSHAEGSTTKATNNGSHAEGYGSLATGINSHAEGATTQATGSASHAEGTSSKANGGDSHAEGYRTTAEGASAHAEGYLTEATGDYSHTEGRATVASDSCAHAEGIDTEASGSYSHAEGNQSVASGASSHAEGTLSKANGSNSHAEGSSTANGSNSHAEGFSTADGAYSHAEGHSTKALSLYSHAEGYVSKASNEASHAEGYYTEASGLYSHSEGQRTIAEGDSSHASGIYTIASGQASSAFGKYNKSKNDSDEDYLFTIGNGIDVSNRSNIIAIDYNKNINLNGNTIINNNITVNGQAYAIDSTSTDNTPKELATVERVQAIADAIITDVWYRDANPPLTAKQAKLLWIRYDGSSTYGNGVLYYFNPTLLTDSLTDAEVLNESNWIPMSAIYT